MLICNKGESWAHFSKRYKNYLPHIDADLTQLLAISSMLSSERRGLWATDNVNIKAQNPLLVEDNQIYLYGPIGAWEDEVGFENLYTAVQAIEADELHLRINSGGGDVMEGVAMINYLHRQDKPIIAHVDAQALSMGASIALAADEILIAPNAKMMVHNPHTIAMGDWRDFERQAEVLKDLSADVVKMLAGHSTMNEGQAWQAVDNETWYNAKEALELGIASTIEERNSGEEIYNRWWEQQKVSAPIDLASLRPENLDARLEKLVASL